MMDQPSHYLGRSRATQVLPRSLWCDPSFANRWSSAQFKIRSGERGGLFFRFKKRALTFALLAVVEHVLEVWAVAIGVWPKLKFTCFMTYLLPHCCRIYKENALKRVFLVGMSRIGEDTNSP